MSFFIIFSGYGCDEDGSRRKRRSSADPGRTESRFEFSFHMITTIDTVFVIVDSRDVYFAALLGS